MRYLIGKRAMWRVAVVGVSLAACSPTSLVDVQPSSTLVDPDVVRTPSGAVQFYNFAITTFAARVGGIGANGGAGNDNMVTWSAVWTDELMITDRAPFMGLAGNMDTRNNTVFIGSGLFGFLSNARVQAMQAREVLGRFAPNSPPAWQGQLQAYEAFALVYLAEAFCSGIPLSTVPLDDVPSSTGALSTAELLERAIALFDSAIVLGADSVRFVNLARVGKGRALLNLGRFDEAAAAVRDVPTDFTYNAEYDPGWNRNFINGRHGNSIAAHAGFFDFAIAHSTVQVVDRKGGNGLVWSDDPRSAVTTVPSRSGAMLIPAKYSRTSAGVLDPLTAPKDNPVRVADGLEARLIEAEADLAEGGAAWLAILNMLRATCIGSAACAPVPGLTSTDLPPLVDPGTSASRLDLLMRERALWLYLTGHRNDDLRRMARLYDRDPSTLWPMGTYINDGFSPLVAPTPNSRNESYGTVVVLSPPDTEMRDNPKYTGCLDLEP